MTLRFRLGLPALILTCNLALADGFQSVSPDDVLAASPNLTYLDLLRLLVPDIAKDAEDYVGHEMIEIRHAGGDGSAAQPEDPITVGTVSAVALDTSHVLLLADLGQADDAAQGVAPLALFDTADGKPKLVDAVDVGFDRFTSPAEPALLDLGRTGSPSPTARIGTPASPM